MTFSYSSGKKVNTDKTRVLFSSNVLSRNKKDLNRKLGLKMTDDLGKYLGVPLIHSRVNKLTYRYILDNVRSKLENWESRHLYLVGRITLAQSMVIAIPVYIMQTTYIPASVCNDIDKLCKNFIWCTSSGHRKIPLVSWSKMQLPKYNGGLGIRSAKDTNKAFLMKLAWGILMEHQALWVKVLRIKYKIHNPSPSSYLQKHPGSNLWRGIKTVWDTVKEEAVWAIKDGRLQIFC